MGFFLFHWPNVTFYNNYVYFFFLVLWINASDFFYWKHEFHYLFVNTILLFVFEVNETYKLPLVDNYEMYRKQQFFLTEIRYLKVSTVISLNCNNIKLEQHQNYLKTNCTVNHDVLAQCALVSRLKSFSLYIFIWCKRWHNTYNFNSKLSAFCFCFCFNAIFFSIDSIH